jgi:hypothetical protein
MTEGHDGNIRIKPRSPKPIGKASLDAPAKIADRGSNFPRTDKTYKGTSSDPSVDDPSAPRAAGRVSAL